ncbi:MAG: hypothetical protein Kow0059_18090 [Candidatus Sumerlaeia bacterium]
MKWLQVQASEHIDINALPILPTTVILVCLLGSEKQAWGICLSETVAPHDRLTPDGRIVASIKYP